MNYELKSGNRVTGDQVTSKEKRAIMRYSLSPQILRKLTKKIKRKSGKIGIWAKALVGDISYIHDLKVVANNIYK
jgi:hypothetical protein